MLSYVWEPCVREKGENIMAKNRKKTETPEAMSELETLSPRPVHWDFGGKLFTQQPLRISRLSDIMETIIDVVVSGGRGALLNEIVANAESGAELSMPALIRMMVGIPKHLPKIASMILVDADDAEDYLDEHMGARNGVAVIKVFVEQNEIGALIQDFFGLVQSVNLTVNQAKEETEAEAKETEVQSSDSEPTKETEEG